MTDEHIWDEINNDRELFMDRTIFGSSYVKFIYQDGRVFWERLDPRPFHGFKDNDDVQ